MSDRHQMQSYPLRLQVELKSLLERLAQAQGQSLNTWIASRIEVSARADGGYCIPLEQLASRIRVLTATSGPKTSPFPLRICDQLRGQVQGFADSNKRSLHQELVFRIVSTLSDDECAQISKPQATGISEQLLKAWTRVDSLILSLGETSLAELPGALKALEAERRTLSRLMGVKTENSNLDEAQVGQDEVND